MSSKTESEGRVYNFKVQSEVLGCNGRQIEAMLLKLISEGGEDVEHFERFQRLGGKQ